MKNLHIKLFALLVAILLSRFVTSEGNSSVMGFFVPVEIMSIPQDKVLMGPLTPQAQVSIKGPSFLVSNVVASPPTFKVRIPQEVQEKYIANLSMVDLHLPPNVQVMSIDPPEIHFNFEDRVQRELPVELTNLGTLRPGLKMEELHITPARVLVDGPKSKIVELRNIQTEPIDLREITEDYSREVALRSLGSRVELSVPRVRIDFRVVPMRAQRRFASLPIEVRSSAEEKLALSTAKVSVDVSGPPEKVNTLRADDIIPYIRLQQGTVTPAEIAVRCDVPKEITVVQIDPPKVQVVKSPAPAGAKRPVAGRKG